MNIRPLIREDIPNASRMIEQVSDIYTKEDFSAKGFEKFRSTVLDQGMRKNMADGFLYWGAFEDTSIIGLIAIKRPAHLFNLFVHLDHHRKGIAQSLWNHMLSQLKLNSVTVFSSRYAIGLYEKFGFVSSGEKIANEEIICYPMLWSKA